MSNSGTKIVRGSVNPDIKGEEILQKYDNGAIQFVLTDKDGNAQILSLVGQDSDSLKIRDENTLCLNETLDKILNQLKIMNTHFAEWDGDEYDGN